MKRNSFWPIAMEILDIPKIHLPQLLIPGRGRDAHLCIVLVTYTVQ